ncbi:sigma factor-like helix-turn-helix DNA-binding protein [Planotetraspora mira]|uniref:sigma factor-like helix-turn-helix DNA-binding protein n=1 Tax=Planotetraspora mira TaxID=58121 RepID=UPI00366EEE41
MGEKLYIHVNKAKLGNKDDIMVIIEKFNPLIKKYSNKLNYYGAESDLIINLIEVIKKIPLEQNSNLMEEKYLIGYISKSLRYKYIRLSKEHNENFEIYVELNESIFNKSCNYNIEQIIVIRDLISRLSKEYEKIIYEIFIKGKTELDISQELKISRQAVNKKKNNALKKLRSYIIDI